MNAGPELDAQRHRADRPRPRTRARRAPGSAAAARRGFGGGGGGGGGGGAAGWLYIMIQILVRIAILGHGLGALVLIGLIVVALLLSALDPTRPGVLVGAREHRTGRAPQRRPAPAPRRARGRGGRRGGPGVRPRHRQAGGGEPVHRRSSWPGSAGDRAALRRWWRPTYWSSGSGGSTTSSGAGGATGSSRLDEPTRRVRRALASRRPGRRPRHRTDRGEDAGLRRRSVRPPREAQRACSSETVQAPRVLDARAQRCRSVDAASRSSRAARDAHALEDRDRRDPVVRRAGPARRGDGRAGRRGRGARRDQDRRSRRPQLRR